jgi:hypothetical protein
MLRFRRIAAEIRRGTNKAESKRIKNPLQGRHGTRLQVSVSSVLAQLYRSEWLALVVGLCLVDASAMIPYIVVMVEKQLECARNQERTGSFSTGAWQLLITVCSDEIRIIYTFGWMRPSNCLVAALFLLVFSRSDNSKRKLACCDNSKKT